MKNYCVYIHINKINNKAYIGQTCQKPEHRGANGYEHCPHFYAAIKKYGGDSFEHIIGATNLTLDEANKLESLLITLFNTTNNKYGYNISAGGDNHKFSAEAAKKISQRMKENNPNKGQGVRGKNAFAKKVICEGKIFDCIKDCAEYYNISYRVMRGYLCGRMSNKFKELGLAYL